MLNYQIVIETVSTIFLVSFPIALIFMIVQKLVQIFTNFVFGKEVKF